MAGAEHTWVSLAVALGIGLLIGAERERRKGEGPLRAPAGIRTFAAAALLGAASLIVGSEPLLAVATLGVAGFAAIAYWRSRAQDPGITTEVALLLTVLLGALAVRAPVLAGALGVALAVLLAARTPLHHFVSAVLTEEELDDALVLLAATLIVLPLLPDRYLGPLHALNPRNIWLLVILILSIGALGHVALRVLGSRRGLPAAGLASGFVSSVATIAAMGEHAREAPELLRPAVAGAALSTVATMVQLALVLAVASRQALAELALPLACGGATALVYGAVFTLRSVRGSASEPTIPGRPFSLPLALLLAAGLSLVLIIAAALESWLGRTGLVVAVAATGFADTRSATISAAALVAAGKIAPGGALLPILAGLSTNTLTKIVATFTAGDRRFAAQIVPGLLLTLAAAWLGALLA